MNEITQEIFLKDAFSEINKLVISKLGFRGLSSNYRGNVIEFPIVSIGGCHYEIGLHKDCHEIALHFQGTELNNKYRSEAFRPYLPKLESELRHRLILGPHEHTGIRKRLWIQLPLKPLTQELLNEYILLMEKLISLTLPILQTIKNKEQ